MIAESSPHPTPPACSPVDGSAASQRISPQMPENGAGDKLSENKHCSF